MRRAIFPLLGVQPAERDAAWERADALLRASVTPEQYAAFERRGYIELPSRKHPGRVYRVDGWRPVTVFDSGQFVGAVCIRPRDQLPGPDVVLARKLLIEGAEDEFLRTGNWLSPAWRPASAAPSLLLLVVLIAPWLAHLARFGYAGAFVAVAVLFMPAVVAIVRRRASVRAQAGPVG